MIFQLFLTAMLLVLFLAALLRGGRVPFLRYGVMLTCLVGALFVWHPDLSSRLANRVGIGRGADLILYCFVVVMLLASFWLLLRLHDMRERLTTIVRHIAISSPQRPPE